MSLKALTDLSSIRHIDRDAQRRLEDARQRHREYDSRIEKQVANKTVGHELLAKTCSL